MGPRGRRRSAHSQRNAARSEISVCCSFSSRHFTHPVAEILASRCHFGIALSLAALVSLVSGTILFKRLGPNGTLKVGNRVQNVAGGLAVAPFAFGVESAGEVVPTWRLLGALAYSMLLVSVLAYLIWFLLLTVIGATAASAIIS